MGSTEQGADLVARLRQEVLGSIERTDQLVRDLNEVFERSKREQREIEREYRERRLKRMLAQDAV